MAGRDQLDLFLASTEARYNEWFETPSEISELRDPAVLVVRAPTDALKFESSGAIVGVVNRDQVWAVVGLSLARSVVEAVIEQVDVGSSPDWFVEIPAAGYAWKVNEVVGPSGPNR